MITWTFKGLAAGAICLALAGCDELATSQAGGAAGSQTNALPMASLARGAVALVPPAGYCIDKRSLRASFALIARCDTLGGTATFGAPLAVITATTVSPEVATSAFGGEGETILTRRQRGNLTLLQVRGTPPSADMRNVFWRGIAPVGGQVVGLAVYEAADGSGLGEAAPDLLAQTMRRTITQTARINTPAQDNSATTDAKAAAN